MIFKQSQLKWQQELKQESESDNFNIWDEKSFIFAELYNIDSNFNFDSQIEKIVTANKRHQQAQMW